MVHFNERRPVLDLYHPALELHIDDDRFVVEMAGHRMARRSDYRRQEARP